MTVMCGLKNAGAYLSLRHRDAIGFRSQVKFEDLNNE